MFDHIELWLHSIYDWIWGGPMLVLILGVGFFLTLLLRGLQFRFLPHSLRLAFGGADAMGGEGDITHFQSLMTALAGTIGISNIVGVATAVGIGGLGALFWMWVTALIGMAIKYAEALLAVKYRTTDANGEMCGGPMYFIEKVLGWRSLAFAFAFFGAIASFGGGNAIQSHSIAHAIEQQFSIPPLWTGVVLAFLTGLTLLGGIKNIGRIAAFLVPFMALFYSAGAFVVLFANYAEIPMVFYTIFEQAWTGSSVVGGAAGVGVLTLIRLGVSRGLMTSEAGLGTASIAAAAAKSDVPGRQAFVSMTGSFLATIVMCSITGLVIGVTGVSQHAEQLQGVALTLTAFESVIPGGGYIVTLGLILFGFTTIIGWAYCGEKCLEYLLGESSIFVFRCLFTIAIIPAAILDLHLVWAVSDIANALMTIPNLIGITALAGEIVQETKSFLCLLQKEAVAAHPFVAD